MFRHSVKIFAIGLLLAGAALAQEEPPPERSAAATLPTPRWPDGHPNLGSTPEHKGYWEIRPIGGVNRGPRPADIPAQPWARAVASYRSEALMHSPLVDCKPAAGPSFFNSPGFEIVEVPEQQKIFILDIAGPHSWRVVYMDGREHPTGPDVRPTYLGHSVGHWEGDTLVIDSVGFVDTTPLAGAGVKHSKDMHVVERVSLENPDLLKIETTITDPKALAEPYHRTGYYARHSDWDIAEYICEDNNRNFVTQEGKAGIDLSSNE